MEVVNEDLTLQANLGSELAGQLELIEGFDNDPIIDFKQLEDFINNEAALHHIYLTDQRPEQKSNCTDCLVEADPRRDDRGACVYALPQHGAYWYAAPPAPLDSDCPPWNADYFCDPQHQHHRTGPLPTDSVSLPNVCANGPTGMDNVKVMSQHPSQQQHAQHPSLHSNPSLQPPGYQQNTGVGIGQLNPSKNPQFCHTQLPDSPPDSGSEPYSPVDGNQTDKATYHVKASIVSNMAGLQHQQLPSAYLPQHHPNHQSPHTPVSPSIVPQQMHASAKSYNGYGGSEPPKLNHPPPTTSSMAPVGMAQLNAQMLPVQVSGMGNLQHQPNKKRKYSESPNNTLTPAILNSMGVNMMSIKQEHPGLLPDCSDTDDIYGSGYDMAGGDGGSGIFLDGMYQMIKWQAYQPTAWATLLDRNYKELPASSYRVDADKGFNFSVSDDSFVCQKKNHFQVTVHVGVSGEPKYFKTPEGIIKPIDHVALHFYGVKMESQSQHIKVEQSQSDRSKRAFYPVRMELVADQVTKVTVGRLHFSETTTNNMRKKGKPNPDQRYFLLVVSLNAHSGDDDTVISAHASEKIIVRASNPGQFDNEIDNVWQKGHTPESIFHTGRVGINTDRPDEPLTVHGNIKMTGHIVQPSDARIKTDIRELDTTEQLRNITQLKVYKYSYDHDYAKYAGLSSTDVADTGVIAQELSKVLPDAVRDTGDIILPSGNQLDNFQVVNKDRIYMENVGAVKELCKVTDKLENRINELETLNKKLTKVKRNSSIKSSCSSKSTSSSNVSCPSSTIMSSGKKAHKTHHHSHRGNYRSSSSSQGSSTDPENACSNQFIHVTIFILVLVMLVCLVLITVLYILEKNEPAVHKHFFVFPTTNSPRMFDENMTSAATTSTMGRHMTTTVGPGHQRTHLMSPPVPPLIPPTCLKTACRTSCCTERPIDDQPRGSTPSKKTPKDDHDTRYNDHKTPPGHKTAGHTTAKQTPPTWVDLPPLTTRQTSTPPIDFNILPGMKTTTQPLPSWTMREPPQPVATHRPGKGQRTTTLDDNSIHGNDIPTGKPMGKVDHDKVDGEGYDATGLEGPRAGDSPGGDMGTQGNSPGGDMGTQGNSPGGDMDTQGDSSVDTGKRLINAGTESREITDDSDDQQNMLPSGPDAWQKMKNKTPKKNNDNRIVVLQNNDNGIQRKRRSALPDLAGAVATIHLPQNNSEILHPIYCTNDNCRNGRGGVYNYTVPFSKVFPIAPLTVEFVMTPNFNLLYCKDMEQLNAEDLCQELQGVRQYSATELPSKDNQWDLPVGNFLRSSYQFRITASTHARDACDLPQSDAGVNYAEYNLKFYRVCDVHG